jgi:hypothetical protein
VPGDRVEEVDERLGEVADQVPGARAGAEALVLFADTAGAVQDEVGERYATVTVTAVRTND